VSAAPAVLDVRGMAPDSPDLDSVSRHLGSGGLIGYPTETVYGFGGLCLPDPVRRLAALKRGDEPKPFLLLVPDARSVEGLAWTDEARELARIFWPGSLTLVLPDPSGIFPAEVRGAVGGVAVRVSPHPLVRVLLRTVQAPVTSTSANEPGGAPARSGQEALQVATELGAGPEMWILDGGTLPPSGPSTIVDFTGAHPTVLREGTIPVSRLGCALPELHER
jgi:L-threonylcarbamoyladenylate synthase